MLYITYKILTYYSGVYKIMKIGHFTTNPQTQAKAASLSSEDTGLKAYMQKIYGYMTVGLAITGLVAWLISGASVNPSVIHILQHLSPPRINQTLLRISRLLDRPTFFWLWNTVTGPAHFLFSC